MIAATTCSAGEIESSTPTTRTSPLTNLLSSNSPSASSPEPTNDQLIATGFHRNEMTTSEGGVLPEKYLVKYAVGRGDTTRWHAPNLTIVSTIPSRRKDYYRFFAYLNNLDRLDRGMNPRARICPSRTNNRKSNCKP
ncbi:MAG: hypothetical protein M2R45_02446 [Verrucomicrobia subdivision 3 bacterium]|nr:hypothetical protein [Limisphaerales bacterium]MCS1416349.1 hypothetical protein [Limisphaerales bacterium]